MSASSLLTRTYLPLSVLQSKVIEIFKIPTLSLFLKKEVDSFQNYSEKYILNGFAISYNVIQCRQCHFTSGSGNYLLILGKNKLWIIKIIILTVISQPIHLYFAWFQI